MKLNKDSSLNRLLTVNTASNYVLMGVRVLQGILITRWLYHYLGDDYYGFWSILWAFFTYMIVFNMGFGAATQKYTAEHLFENDIKKYNGVISIIFTFYSSISILITAVVVLGAIYITSWTGLTDPTKIETCRTALLIFGIGTAILFPLAMYSDILAGLRLIYIKNSVLLFIRISEALGVLAMIWLDWGFISIVTFSVSINIFFNWLMSFTIKRQIPGFKLRPTFSLKIFKEIYNFSAFAYINSIGNLVIAKTDRFVLGAILGLPSVSLYQLGTRMPEISQTLSSQFQDNVVPVSANLIHTGNTGALSKILLSGMRFGSFVSIGATAIFFEMTEQTLKFLFDVSNPTITFICQVFLISQLISCAVRGVPARYLLMAGRHKFIATTTVVEAVVNILLSIYLCHKIGIMGVVWGTLIPNAIISCGVVFPAAVRALKFKKRELSAIFLKPILAVIPSALICEFVKYEFPQTVSDFLPLTLTYMASGLVYLLTSWLFVLTQNEREMLTKLLKFNKN